MKYPDRVRGWGFDPEDDYAFRFDLSRWPLILNATNLKIIPTCGLTLAAVWFHGRHPEAGKWLDLAIIYATGKRAILTLEKDDKAQSLFTEVFDAWAKEASAAPAAPKPADAAAK